MKNDNLRKLVDQQQLILITVSASFVIRNVGIPQSHYSENTYLSAAKVAAGSRPTH